MRSVGFIGQSNNEGIILCVAKLISSFGKRVVIIDATSSQRTRYTVPCPQSIRGQEQYITQYDGVDVAIGFNNILELKKHMISQGEDFNDYEYVIINTDREEMCEEFDIKNANSIFFATTFDLSALHRGVELLKFVCATKRREDTTAILEVNKMLSYIEIKTQGNQLIDNLTKDLPINWNGADIIISFEEGDGSAFIENQYSNKIEFKNISRTTKEGLIEAVVRITGEPRDRVSKAVKNTEKVSMFSRK